RGPGRRRRRPAAPSRSGAPGPWAAPPAARPARWWRMRARWPWRPARACCCPSRSSRKIDARCRGPTTCTASGSPPAPGSAPAPHSRRRLEALDARVRVLLRMTAYQLVFLERVPAFAAVNDAVSLARSGARGAAEYTNAVLRAFARRGAREREPAPPRDPIDALATRCSFPTWLAARWVTRYGAAEAEALMRAMNERPPLTLRANTLRLSREALAARLAAE